MCASLWVWHVGHRNILTLERNTLWSTAVMMLYILAVPVIKYQLNKFYVKANLSKVTHMPFLIKLHQHIYCSFFTIKFNLVKTYIWDIKLTPFLIISHICLTQKERNVLNTNK
jgi:hypothetical protein